MSPDNNNVILRIRNHLKDNDKADINSIAKSIGSNWSTTRNKLELLKDLGNVKEERGEGRRYFSWVEIDDYKGDKTQNVLFNLPVEPKDLKTANWLYSQITEACKKKYHKTPSNTISQKILVDVIKKAEIIDLPVGWYLYGEICPIMPSENLPKAISLPNEYVGKKAFLIDCINESVSIYGGLTPFEAERKQYEQYKNRLYLLKNEITRALYQGHYSEPTFKMNIFTFAMEVKYPEDNDYLKKLVNAFVELSIVLSDIEIPKKVKGEIKESLISAFCDVWKCIGLNEFYTSLLWVGYYDKVVLDSQSVWPV